MRAEIPRWRQITRRGSISCCVIVATSTGSDKVVTIDNEVRYSRGYIKMLRPIYLASVEELEEHPDKGVLMSICQPSRPSCQSIYEWYHICHPSVRVSPDNKGGMVGEDEHWFFLKRLLLSKEKGKEGRVSWEDGAMSSQRVGRRDNRHVRDEHRLAHRLHHVPARHCNNVAQAAVSRLFDTWYAEAQQKIANTG